MNTMQKMALCFGSLLFGLGVGIMFSSYKVGLVAAAGFFAILLGMHGLRIFARKSMKKSRH
ncbi:MAG: hypothetical protein LBT59_28245 [Clostridiales bacterium]|nr:hypothetical protein [Clostridiales bacterium]